MLKKIMKPQETGMIDLISEPSIEYGELVRIANTTQAEDAELVNQKYRFFREMKNSNDYQFNSFGAANKQMLEIWAKKFLEFSKEDTAEQREQKIEIVSKLTVEDFTNDLLNESMQKLHKIAVKPFSKKRVGRWDRTNADNVNSFFERSRFTKAWYVTAISIFIDTAEPTNNNQTFGEFVKQNEEHIYDKLSKVDKKQQIVLNELFTANNNKIIDGITEATVPFFIPNNNSSDEHVKILASLTRSKFKEVILFDDRIDAEHMTKAETFLKQILKNMEVYQNFTTFITKDYTIKEVKKIQQDFISSLTKEIYESKNCDKKEYSKTVSEAKHFADMMSWIHPSISLKIHYELIQHLKETRELFETKYLLGFAIFILENNKMFEKYEYESAMDSFYIKMIEIFREIQDGKTPEEQIKISQIASIMEILSQHVGTLWDNKRRKIANVENLETTIFEYVLQKDHDSMPFELFASLMPENQILSEKITDGNRYLHNSIIRAARYEINSTDGTFHDPAHYSIREPL